MQYVISDIHGCCEQFKKLLKLIRFSDEDTLYVLGDVVDRGPDPLGVLRIMASYYNIVPVLGNHEYMMLRVLPSLLEEIREDNIEKTLTADFLQSYRWWMEDGGKVTADVFRKLSDEDREFYLEYVREFSLYEEVSAAGRDFLLIHSLPGDFHISRSLDYRIEEIIFGRPDFHADWKQDVTCVIGHTPTFLLGDDYRGKIYQKNHLIDIDCGCAAGYRLCAYCLETGEAYYV